jgi:hypothetical protein
MFDIAGSLDSIVSALQGGAFADASLGEPKAPPDDMHASVTMLSMAVVGTTLAHPIESHVIQVRLYMRTLEDDPGVTEKVLALAVSQFVSDLSADVDFGGEVRNVDIGGQYNSLTGSAGYIDVGGVMFRVVDVNVPLTVDDTDAGFG